MSGQLHAPVALPTGKKPPVQIGYEAGWARGPVWTLWSTENSLAPTGNRTPAVQSVTCRYTDWAVGTQFYCWKIRNIKSRVSSCSWGRGRVPIYDVTRSMYLKDLCTKLNNMKSPTKFSRFEECVLVGSVQVLFFQSVVIKSIYLIWKWCQAIRHVWAVSVCTYSGSGNSLANTIILLLAKPFSLFGALFHDLTNCYHLKFARKPRICVRFNDKNLRCKNKSLKMLSRWVWGKPRKLPPILT
jgi:hypothetical protein